MLDRVTSYFQSFSPIGQAAILGVLSLLLLFQAARRHEEQTLVAFMLALGGIVLLWLAFAKGCQAY
jgi:hypothetical protein